ncbi:hypothetical protein AAV33_07675 [Corynebacterium otitidis]|nr:hypothetical protein AAV33_07675 [Corynebacterium otitidis]
MGRRRKQQPLPVRDGLNPSRARVTGTGPVKALDFLRAVVEGQRHRHPADDDAAIARRFMDGQVVDGRGRTLTGAEDLEPGTDVWFYRMPAPETPVPGDLRRIYEDDRILVVHKPPFLATTPKGRHITQTVTTILRRSLSNPQLSPVHRLDRLTEGLLILAKHEQYRGAYQRLFEARAVEKRYTALAAFDAAVASNLPTTISNRIVKNVGTLQAHVEDGESNATTAVHGVKRVCTQHSGQEVGEYDLRPATGKTHQLRLHMAQMGIAICNDPLYPTVTTGAGEPDDYNRPLRLCCTELSFADPISGTPVKFETTPSWRGRCYR